MADGKPGAPFGNQNSKGKGRKPAWAERADGEIARKIFFKDFDIEEAYLVLEKLKAKKGRLSIKEVMIAKAMTGNERLIADIWKKVAADKLEYNGAVPVKNILTEETNEPPDSNSAGTANGGTPDHRGQERSTDPVSTEPSPAFVTSDSIGAAFHSGSTREKSWGII